MKYQSVYLMKSPYRFAVLNPFNKSPPRLFASLKSSRLFVGTFYGCEDRVLRYCWLCLKPSATWQRVFSSRLSFIVCAVERAQMCSADKQTKRLGLLHVDLVFCLRSKWFMTKLHVMVNLLSTCSMGCFGSRVLMPNLDIVYRLLSVKMALFQ